MRTNKMHHQHSHHLHDLETPLGKCFSPLRLSSVETAGHVRQVGMLRIWLYALPPLAVLLTCLVWASQTFASDVKPLSASSTEQQSAKSDTRDAQSVTAVDSIPPEAIESYLKNHSDVVVQFTSPDTNCSFCIAGFAPFNKAALTYGRRAKFVRVQWSPWQDVPKNIQALYQVNAVPVQYVVRNGRVVGRYFGLPEPIKFDAWLNKQFGATK